jgi:predicted ATP-grasp superfamily ATP-dependent carboligase
LLDPLGFASCLGALAIAQRIDLLIPMTDPSVEAVLEHRGRLPSTVRLPLPELSRYRAASDKARIAALAAECGFGVPDTLQFATPSEARNGIPDSAFFPAVIKPHRSVILERDVRRKVGVAFVADPAGCRSVLDALPDAAFPVLLQRRVTGVGEGFFALRWGGRPVAMFAHRRIREKPPAGGVSVYRESIPLHRDLAVPGLRLLEALDWQGVAMVECKRDAATGRAIVMEVNGRFWGSLQLAIDAGIDFPALLARCAAGETVHEHAAYRIGVRSRWFWGDVDHLLLRLRRSRAVLDLDANAPSRLRAIGEFLRLRPGRDREEVWRWRDPRPFALETLRWLRAALTRGRRGATRKNTAAPTESPRGSGAPSGARAAASRPSPDRNIPAGAAARVTARP